MTLLEQVTGRIFEEKERVGWIMSITLHPADKILMESEASGLIAGEENAEEIRFLHIGQHKVQIFHSNDVAPGTIILGKRKPTKTEQ